MYEESIVIVNKFFVEFSAEFFDLMGPEPKKFLRKDFVLYVVVVINLWSLFL